MTQIDEQSIEKIATAGNAIINVCAGMNLSPGEVTSVLSTCLKTCLATSKEIDGVDATDTVVEYLSDTPDLNPLMYTY